YLALTGTLLIHVSIECLLLIFALIWREALRPILWGLRLPYMVGKITQCVRCVDRVGDVCLVSAEGNYVLHHELVPVIAWRFAKYHSPSPVTRPASPSCLMLPDSMNS